jgi:hypothetical protein
MIRPFAILPLVALTLAASAASAADPIDADWPEVARVQDGNCELSVTGNGRFYRIAASGLGGDAPGRFFLSNGDMKPLDWSIRSTGNGEFARYYLPFRWHREGGAVLVSLESARCNLAASFAWRRAGVVVR